MNVKLPPLAIVALLCMLSPAYFSIGSVVLSPSRLFFLFLTPVLTVQLLMGKFGKLLLIDILVLANIFWSALSIFVNNTSVAVQFVGMNSTVILGGYLVARATIKTPADFLAVAKFLTIVTILSLPFTAYEVVTNKYVIPEFFNSIPGVNGVAKINYIQRMGLYRAQFVFAHPIHYGLFCSIAFGLAFYGLKGRVSAITRLLVCTAIGIGCFLSVSSGPFLSLMIQLVLIIYAGMTKSVPARWKILIVGVLLLYIVLEIISNGPAIYRLISMLTFSSSTANVRRVLFDFGIAQVGRTPVLGIGYNSWNLPHWMSGSLDNYWLLQALVYGLPAFLFLAGAFIIALFQVGKRPFDNHPLLIAARLGWVFVIISLILTLATVSIWGEIQSLVFFTFGSGMWMLTHTPDAADGTSAADARHGETSTGRDNARSRYTRFGKTDPAGPARPERSYVRRSESADAGKPYGRRKS